MDFFGENKKIYSVSVHRRCHEQVRVETERQKQQQLAAGVKPRKVVIDIDPILDELQGECAYQPVPS